MAEVLPSRLSLATAATAASLALHAALLSIAVRRTAPPPEAPAGPRVVLSIAGAAPAARLAAVEAPTPAALADETPAVPPLPAPVPTESLPEVADALAAVAPPPPAVASPLPAADVAVVAEPREAPPALDPTAPQSLAEAPPPASLLSPPALPVVVEVQPAVAPGQPAPAIAAPDLPAAPDPVGTSPTPVAAPPRQLAEAAPPAALSPLPDAAVPAVPAPASDAGTVAGEPATPSTPPPAMGAVQAPDTAIAALEPPPVSAERVRAFVDGYDGGPCFFASVAGTATTRADVETFSATVDQVMAFHAAFMGQVGVEPHVVGQRVWSAQCPVVDFLRRTRATSDDPLALRLDRREMRRGETLAGVVGGAGARHVEVFLVSEAGQVTDLGGAARRADGTATFTIPLPPGRPGGPFPEMVIATADDAPSRPGSVLAEALSSARAPAPSTVRSAAELLLVRR